MSNICQYLVEKYFNQRALLLRNYEIFDPKAELKILEIGMLASCAGCGDAFAKELVVAAEKSERNKEYYMAKIDRDCAELAISHDDMGIGHRGIDSLLAAIQSDTNLTFVNEYLSDATSTAYIMADNKNLTLSAHKTLDNLRETLSNRNFFPLVTEIGSWGDFQKNVWNDLCVGREKLYHAVPEEFCPGFESGNLGFRSLRALRGEGAKRQPEDAREGRVFGSGYVGDEEIGIVVEEASFVFCLTRSEEFASGRKGSIVYEVNMPDFIESLFDLVKGKRGYEWANISDLRYYDSNHPYKGKSFEVTMKAGDVVYGEPEDKSNPNPFSKGTDFSPEEEVRIVISLGPDSCTAKADGEDPFQYLTGNSPGALAFVNVGRSRNWMKKTKNR